MFQKNVTHDGIYEVNDGTSDIYSLGLINKWQNDYYLHKMWKGEKSECNKITGRDSITYPPDLYKRDKVVVFITDICR